MERKKTSTKEHKVVTINEQDDVITDKIPEQPLDEDVNIEPVPKKTRKPKTPAQIESARATMLKVNAKKKEQAQQRKQEKEKLIELEKARRLIEEHKELINNVDEKTKEAVNKSANGRGRPKKTKPKPEPVPEPSSSDEEVFDTESEEDEEETALEKKKKYKPPKVEPENTDDSSDSDTVIIPPVPPPIPMRRPYTLNEAVRRSNRINNNQEKIKPLFI